ncbi:thiamine diphosphokinase [Lactobacillus sp. YT155]|uniref:thiamine diphosphokinase n=1 Tax=Lactobacillus sp. YT155 TaxID=3060955 RepID=UPI00265F808D|nr:thiamine diphosphokinase [Lactobacillus sp. YT155]MDO1605542.1 thiamine diphosphokinase [Lactobacillus sp. YT155]
MKVVNILLGGPKQQYPSELLNQPQAIKGDWVAADHGTIYLLKNGIVPKFSVGDFDSSSDSELNSVEKEVAQIIKVPAEKDFTDSQLALKTVMKNFQYDEIHVYGATGGRIDHLLVNLFLGLEEDFNAIIEQVKIIDIDNYIEFFNPGQHLVTKKSQMKYIGFVNFGPVKQLNLLDSKYQLEDFTSEKSISWASNEFVNETINFSFEAGFIAAIQSKD